MSSIIESLLGHDFWVHLGLIAGEIVSTFVVGWGIIWEGADQSASRHRIAPKLVIWGIIFETVCSVSLFAFDETISHRQQDRIIALNEKLAPRRLSADQEKAVSDKLKDWAEFPHSDLRQKAEVFATTGSFESAALADQIEQSLKEAGWTVTRRQTGVAQNLTLLGVGVLATSDIRGSFVAGTVVKALTDAKIGAFIVPMPNKCAEAGTDSLTFPINACSEIAIAVGDHP